MQANGSEIIYKRKDQPCKNRFEINQIKNVTSERVLSHNNILQQAIERLISQKGTSISPLTTLWPGSLLHNGLRLYLNYILSYIFMSFMKHKDLLISLLAI